MEMISKTKLYCKAVLTLFCRLPLSSSSLFSLKRAGGRSRTSSTQKDFIWAPGMGRAGGEATTAGGSTRSWHIVGTWPCYESETLSTFLSLPFCFVNLPKWLTLPWAWEGTCGFCCHPAMPAVPESPL